MHTLDRFVKYRFRMSHRFLQVLYDTRTGPVSILNWTLFVCLSVCGCMIIGRAQKMLACDWLQYFHSACILKTGKS